MYVYFDRESNGYIGVEYLEKPRTQCIYTGIYPVNHKIEDKLKYVETINEKVIFVTFNSTYQDAYHMKWYNNSK